MRRVLLGSLALAIIWGGAAGLAIGIHNWLDDPGVSDEQLARFVEDSLERYPTEEDLSLAEIQFQEDLARVELELLQGGTSGRGLEATVARLLLILAARGLVIPDVFLATYFPASSSADLESCMNLLRNTAEVQTGGSVEACIRLESEVVFPE